VLDASLEQFSILENQIIDLGRTKGFDGQPNAEAKQFYTLAFRTVAIGMTLLQFIWFTTFKRHRARLWGGAGFLLALLAAFHLWGVVEFPMDENFPRHFQFLKRALAALSISSLCIGFAYYFEPKYKDWPARLWWITGIISVAQWVFLVYGPAPWSSHSVLLLQYSMQKLMWTAQFVAYMVHGYFVIKRVRKT
jgi:hypothetical protein